MRTYFWVVLLLASAAFAQTDNYYEIRAKAAPRVEKDKAHRKPGEVAPEDQYAMAFEKWDRQAREHLDAGSHRRGKIADMARHLHEYRDAQLSRSTAPVCLIAGGGNWTSLGPATNIAAPIIGKVTAVYIDPNNPNLAYAGAPGGLFKTVNNGASWTDIISASRYPTLGVSSIAVDPNAPTTMYVATNADVIGSPGYSIATLKTTDGGATWNEVFTLAPFNNQANFNVIERTMTSKVMLHPQDPNTVFILAANYIFRSTDAGATWTKVKEIPVPTNNVNGCGYRPVDIDIIDGANGVSDSTVLVSTVRTAWMGVANSPCGTAKTFLSTSGGALNTFNEVTGNVLGSDLTDRIGAAVQPGNSSEFFIGYQNMVSGAFVLKRYKFGAGTTTPVGTVTSNGVFQLGAGFWDLELQFSQLNPNRLYAAGTTAYIFNVGGTFSATQISSYWATDPTTCAPLAKTHGDVRAMMISHTSTQDIDLIGTDGGIHKAVLDPNTAYNPTTANWKDLSGPGLALNEFFDINGSQSDPDLWVAGSQDDGTIEYKNGVWTQRENYDGWQGAINQSTGQYFGMTNAGAIRGATGTAGTYPFTSSPAISSGPVITDPNNPSVLYAGGAQLYKSTNFGTSWTTITIPGTTNVHVIQVAPSNSNVIYVAREGQTWDPNNLTVRLFRSTNGGTSWTDLTANVPAVAWAGISDIAVDPDDANHLFLSFNGYWPVSQTSTNGANRVWESANGGTSFTDLTYNLLAFPVATMIYRRGSNDELYIGTDVGVFQFDKASNTWRCFNNGMPTVSVTRLEINYCRSTITASTSGRGALQSDLPILQPEVVASSATWSGIRYLSNDLTIKSGATLTLNGTLNMSKDRRIIVERGATLNVNGGTITNCCGAMWHGIDLWGNAAALQSAPGAQGKVILQANGKIEHAVEAITTGRDNNGTFDWSYTGGIVQCSNATFSNNRRSVQFMYYHAMNGPNEINNQSSFRNCTFETTRRLNDPIVLPDAHVSLYEVTGVQFLGCKFNDSAPLTAFDVNHRGNGINSYDAKYTVADLMNTMIIPNTLIAPSIFNGLTYGVRADYTASVNKNVTVTDTDFNNVQRGVQVTNSVGSTISGNSFNALPNALTTSFAGATWGVRVFRAASFALRGNTVTGASAAYQNDYGIIVDDCGAVATNIVQGNQLTNLYTGIQAMGSNGMGTNGVQFRCNTFQPAMAYQLAVQASGTLADQGLASCQFGSTADNTFFAQATPAGSQINSGISFAYYASGTVPSNISGPVTVSTCGGVSGECSANPMMSTSSQ